MRSTPRAVAIAVVLGSFGLLGGGCEDPPIADAGPTAAERSPLQLYCAAVCKRATECGLRAASGIARTSSDEEKALVAAHEKAAAETEQKCVSTCGSTPAESAEGGRFQAAEHCLATRECNGFMACLDEVGKGS